MAEPRIPLIRFDGDQRWHRFKDPATACGAEIRGSNHVLSIIGEPRKIAFEYGERRPLCARCF